MKISVAYPVHSGLASCYAHVKGFNPNEEFFIWQKSGSCNKRLSIILLALLFFLAISVAALFFVKEQKGPIIMSKEEGELFALAVPSVAVFIVASIISLNLFESWHKKRKAFRNMRTFILDYSEFMDAVGATDEEIGEWSDQKLKHACIAVLESERSKIDAMKTSRGKAPRLKDLIDVYKRMNLVGIRFDSVDDYIRQVRLSIEQKPKTSRIAKSGVETSKNVIKAYEPAA